MYKPIWIVSVLVLASTTICVFLCGSYIYKSLQLRHQRQYQQLITTQFPYALQILSASLHAGITLAQALQLLSEICPTPLCSEWRYLGHERKLGIDIDQVLENFSQRNPSPDIKMAIAMLQIAYISGGAIANTLEKIAHSMQQQTLLNEKVKALTAQGRLQGKILAALPIVLMLAIQVIDPEAGHVLWYSVEGWAALAVIVVLESLGIVWIRRLTHARF